jgi:hypothetical protein
MDLMTLLNEIRFKDGLWVALDDAHLLKPLKHVLLVEGVFMEAVVVCLMGAVL